MAKVKKNVFPHSQAKLNLYNDYLSEYLPILGYSQYIDRINLFDIFCGEGVYEDGNIGSPIIAVGQILNTVLSFQEKGKRFKPIQLFINDFDKKKVEGVKTRIDNLVISNCHVEAYNLDADDMFKVVEEKIKSFTQRERNLVFIDPYGYSKINKERLYSILKNRRTEVILFLPVAHMYRFTDAIYEPDSNPNSNKYEGLKNFTFSFFGDNSFPASNIFEYINSLTKAFSFDGEFYSSSHYIQRDNANYYAVFFIGHHIYGLEKFLEVKWKNDSLGKGFSQKSMQGSLFAATIEEYDKDLTEQALRKVVLDKLKDGQLNNIELYEFVLKNQFLPKHINGVLKNLIKDNKVVVLDKNNSEVSKISSFGLNSVEFKKGDFTYLYKVK